MGTISNDGFEYAGTGRLQFEDHVCSHYERISEYKGTPNFNVYVMDCIPSTT